MIYIRKMVVDDVYRGFLDVLDRLSPVDLTPVEAIEVFKARAENTGLTTYVAVHGAQDGPVVGTASILIERKFLHSGRSAGHIEDVAVHQDWAGRGIGGHLIDALLDLARLHNCYKVTLACKPELNEFYAKHGFTIPNPGLRAAVTQ